VIGEVPAQGLTGKAHGYLSSQWPKLVRVLDRLPLDTNGVESAIRPFVVGGKNRLFADTVRGAKASGIEPFPRTPSSTRSCRTASIAP